MPRTFFLAALASLATLAPAQEPAGALDSGLVRSLELERLEGTFVQHFRLDRPGAYADEPPLALVRYVAGPDRAGGVRADLELAYLDDEVRVIHAEQTSFAQRRVVFRELRARAGRTLFLEGAPEGGLAGYELGGSEVVRHKLAEPGELPLLLVESMRRGRPLPGEALVLDPLAATFEPLQLTSRPGTGPGSDERVFEARRSDGSLRWRVSARGEELLEWRFQERGPAARAITPEEFQRLHAQHELGMREVREAAAAAEARKHPALRRR